MISVIIRCRNRLEYTTLCMNYVRLRTKLPHEIIVVDNDSSDGTKEWLSWMASNTSWYENVKVLHMDRNTGDWGGMLVGYRYSSGDFIVQLDNDIEVPPYWLTQMKYALENTTYPVVMLKRDNVAWKLPAKHLKELPNGLLIGQVERPVACFMTRRETFRQFADKITEKNGLRSKYIIKKLTGGRIGKLMNLRCLEMEADYQREKYNPKNPQIWEKV